jgi:hypothetical protein
MELLPVDDQALEWLIDHSRRHRGDGSSFAGWAPAVFERYLRILHPAQIAAGGVPRDVSWREVADATGRTLLPSSRFEDFGEIREVAGFKDLVSPAGMTDDLGDVQCRQLVEVLGAGNTEPDGCIVGFASHWASLVPSSPALKPVRLKGDTYLFAASSFVQVCEFLTPSFWWPKDQSWIVVTPSDTTSSLMGCGAQTAAAVLSVGVEALVIGPDDQVLP